MPITHKSNVVIWNINVVNSLFTGLEVQNSFSIDDFILFEPHSFPWKSNTELIHLCNDDASAGVNICEWSDNASHSFCLKIILIYFWSCIYLISACVRLT